MRGRLDAAEIRTSRWRGLPRGCLFRRRSRRRAIRAVLFGIAAQAADGAVLEHSAFIPDDCGRCPRGPDTDWSPDFSNSFSGEGESCTHAPSKLVDGDRRTGWAEGGEGDGIGVDVVIPQLRDLSGPVRIRAGYGKSPELFAANGRPKRAQVTVLRVRAAEPDPHDATGCSTATFVEPVVVAGHEIDLRGFNGCQALPVPEFRREYYLEYPMGWLLMDGTERMLYRLRADAGEAAPFERGPNRASVPTPTASGRAWGLALEAERVDAANRHGWNTVCTHLVAHSSLLIQHSSPPVERRRGPRFIPAWGWNGNGREGPAWIPIATLAASISGCVWTGPAGAAGALEGRRLGCRKDRSTWRSP